MPNKNSYYQNSRGDENLASEVVNFNANFWLFLGSCLVAWPQFEPEGLSFWVDQLLLEVVTSLPIGLAMFFLRGTIWDTLSPVSYHISPYSWKWIFFSNYHNFQTSWALICSVFHWLAPIFAGLMGIRPKNCVSDGYNLAHFIRFPETIILTTLSWVKF